MYLLASQGGTAPNITNVNYIYNKYQMSELLLRKVRRFAVDANSTVLGLVITSKRVSHKPQPQ